jgi:hypothetical protein
MKQIIFIVALIGLIYSCKSHDKKTNRFEQNIALGQNIDILDYDEKTGWTRILLKEPHNWGFIDKDSNVVIPFIFKFLNPFDSAGMALGYINDKQGFINTNCETIIPFIYDDLSVFNLDLAPAKLHGKTGFINRKGETAIPFTYDDVNGFNDCGVSEVIQNNKWGCINMKGETVIPLIYSNIDSHNKDSLFFALKDDKWAIFDHFGKQKSDFIYDEIYGTSKNTDYFNDKYLFNGLLLVRKGNQYHYLNRDLEIVTDLGYFSKAEPISEYGHAIVKKGKYYGIINTKAEIVVPSIYPKIEHPSMEFQGFYDEFYIYKNGKVGLLNREAKPITDISYSSFKNNFSYKNGKYFKLYVAKKDKKCGLIDLNGNIIAPIEYDEIGEFESNSCAIAKKNGLYGIINNKGQVRVPSEYSSITTYHFDKNYVVKKNGKYGIINKETLKKIIPLEYDKLEVSNFDQTRFIAKKNGKFGIIDKNLKIIIPFEYDKISNLVDHGPEEHIVEKNGKEGLISRDGKIVIPPVYDKIYVDKSSLIKVKNDGVYGTINWKNKIVNPIEYEQILWENPDLTGRQLDTIYLKKSGKYFATDTKGKVILKSVSEKMINEKFGFLNKFFDFEKNDK